MKKIDLTNSRFGRMLVIKENGKDRHGSILWECKCDCGTVKTIKGDWLKRGAVKSCGCYNREQTIKRNYKHGHNTRKKTTSEYIAWNNMIARCENPNDPRYNTYGKRGVVVCEGWRNSFKSFLEHIGARPSKKLSVDRIDNDGNYEPGNVRWGISEQQFRNKTNNHWIEYNGVKMILQDWAKKLKTDYRHIIRMLKKKSFGEVYEFYFAKNMSKQKKI